MKGLTKDGRSRFVVTVISALVETVAASLQGAENETQLRRLRMLSVIASEKALTASSSESDRSGTSG